MFLVTFQEYCIIFQSPIDCYKGGLLASFCSDHSPIILTIVFEPNNKRRKGLQKFHKSLFSRDGYTYKLKNHGLESLSIYHHKYRYKKCPNQLRI